MKVYLDKMHTYAYNQIMSNRIRYKLLDVVKLGRRGWKPERRQWAPAPRQWRPFGAWWHCDRGRRAGCQRFEMRHYYLFVYVLTRQKLDCGLLRGVSLDLKKKKIITSIIQLDRMTAESFVSPGVHCSRRFSKTGVHSLRTCSFVPQQSMGFSAWSWRKGLFAVDRTARDKHEWNLSEDRSIASSAIENGSESIQARIGPLSPTFIPHLRRHLHRLCSVPRPEL